MSETLARATRIPVEVQGADRARVFWTSPDRAPSMYWHDVEHSHRDVLMAGLSLVAPFGSVLEIGANAGPNLRRIHAAWPAAHLYATDVNGAAMDYGAAQARAEGWSFWRATGPAEEVLPCLATDAVDVVLSCYSLCFAEPEAIEAVLGHMLRIARAAVVLAEPMTSETEAEGWVPELSVPEWRTDYVRLLDALAPPSAVCHLLPIAPPVQRLTGVLVVDLAPRVSRPAPRARSYAAPPSQCPTADEGQRCVLSEDHVNECLFESEVIIA